MRLQSIERLTLEETLTGPDVRLSIARKGLALTAVPIWW